MNEIITVIVAILPIATGIYVGRYLKKAKEKSMTTSIIGGLGTWQLSMMILYGIFGNFIESTSLSKSEKAKTEWFILSEKGPDSQNGKISPTEMVEIKLEIPHAYDEPILKDIQRELNEYAFKKYNGIQKVSISVFVKGMPPKGTPYAALNYIAGDNNIVINGSKHTGEFSNSLPKLKELEGYTIIGMWYVYEESGFVIASKNDEVFCTYFNIENSKIEGLKPLIKKEIKGDTAYTDPDDNTEYMIIKPDGLHIYDNTNERPTILHNIK